MTDVKLPTPSQLAAQYSDERSEGANGHLTRIKPSNDNGGAGDPPTETGPSQLDIVVFSLARLIGRQIAREEFESLRATNDNQTVDLHLGKSGGINDKPDQEERT
jgi:hypothetical protein